MPTNKFERDFAEQGHLKRPGRVDLQLFQHLGDVSDGYGGLQFMVHKLIGGVFNKFVVEGCQYTGGAVQQGYILYEGKVIKVVGETIAVANGEWLYLDSNGSAHVTSTENVAMANAMVYMKESDGTEHDLRFRLLENVMNLYQLTVNQNIDVYGDHIDLHDGDLDNVRNIKGYSTDPITIESNLDANGKNIINIGVNNVNINSLVQGEINQIANIDTVTITNTQWGYLGASDQGIAKATNPFEVVRLILSQTTGTAPITVSSTTKVSNLNVDYIDGIHVSTLTSGRLIRYNSTGTQLENATVTESAGALGGITTISMSDQLTNTKATGTAPFVITSTTKVSNLNVDRVDDFHFDQELLIASSPQFANIYIDTDIIHSGDTDTKLTFGTNTIDLRTGGNSRLDISDTGVRIGASGQRVTTISNSIVDSATQLVSGAGIYVHSNAKTNPHEVSLEQARTKSNSLSGSVDMNRYSLTDLGELVMGDTTYKVPSYPNANGGWGSIVVWQVDQNTQGLGNLFSVDVDGNLINADKDDNKRVVGIALETSTGAKKVLLSGFIYNSAWSFGSYIGQPVYCGDSGQLIADISAFTTGDFVKKVGVVLSAYLVYFDPDNTVIEIF